MNLIRIPLTTAAALGAIYLAFSPRINIPLYSKLLFHPDKYPIGDYHVDMMSDVKRRDVYFPSSNGRTLHGWFFQNPNATKTILFHHGNGGNLTTRMGLVSVLLQAGASVLIYDYQGYGRSEGQPSVRKICEDGVAAYKYLVEKAEINPDNIINYGESLGSGVASYLSTVVPTGALVLQSGFESLRRIGGEHVPPLRAYPSWLYPQPLLDNVCVVKKKHPPLLIIHGMKDGTVPFAHAEQVFEHATEPKKFVRLPNSDHIDLYLQDPDLFRESVREFLQSLAVPLSS
jgi:fermentation-respiration switch protein FrsA (DUF1100 family)